jgi:fluoride ion exporter CrcB/FEX
MTMVSKKLLPLIFIGGAFGTSLRYSIEILLGTMPQGQILVTSFVNLLGALLLGYVAVHKYYSSSQRQALWGVGFLGGFTTMSGLAAVTAGSELGLSSFGAIYWLLVLLQLVIGVSAYRLGSVIAGGVSK